MDERAHMQTMKRLHFGALSEKVALSQGRFRPYWRAHACAPSRSSLRTGILRRPLAKGPPQ